MLHGLGLRVKIIEAILIGLDPVVPLRVHVKALDTAVDALLVQPAGRRTIHLFRGRIIDRVVHALLQPQATTIPLLYLVNTIVAQRGRIFIVGKVGTHPIAIVSVQAIACTQPHIAPRIAQDTVDH